MQVKAREVSAVPSSLLAELAVGWTHLKARMCRHTVDAVTAYREAREEEGPEGANGTCPTKALSAS